MCESSVYLRTDEGDELVMQDAVLIEREGGKIKLTDILGEKTDLQGEIEEITFLEHRVIVRKK